MTPHRTLSLHEPDQPLAAGPTDRIPSSGFRRIARSIIHAFAYQLLVRPARSRTDTIHMLGFTIHVSPPVFHPRFFLTTKYLGRYLNDFNLRGAQLLEIGSGSGLLSLVAARCGASVTAVDINSHAVECTLLNARLNRLETGMRVLQSDLFQRLSDDNLYDYIVWNPPFYPVEPTDDESRAWSAGTDYSVIVRFARKAGNHLRSGGVIIMVLSSETDVPFLLSTFASCGFKPTLAQSSRRLFETLSIYEFRK